MKLQVFNQIQYKNKKVLSNIKSYSFSKVNLKILKLIVITCLNERKSICGV